MDPSTSSSTDGKFTNNHLVVITSNRVISMFSWKYYLVNNWNEIMEENTQLLILGGIHGCEDGKLGEVDQRLEKEIEFYIRKLKEEKKDEINDFNIEIMYEFVGDFLDKDTWQPQPKELVDAILKHQPTVLLLAFCYTTQSILNDCLRSQGIYSLLIAQKERENITKGRCIFLDDRQKSALLRIAQERPKLVLFQGNFVTGKTVLLMEALRIKISQYEELKQSVRVIVTSDTKQKDLIQHLESHYKYQNVEMEFHDCLKDVPVNDELGTAGQVNSVADLNACIRRIANSTKCNIQQETKNIAHGKVTSVKKIILVIDEFFIKGVQDWNQFEIHPDVDVLIAFHPRKESEIPFVLPCKDKPGVLCCSLDTMYRNSYEVLLFCSFLSNHAPQVIESSTAKTYPMLDLGKIDEIRSVLPFGQTPVWIQLESDHLHPVAVFQYIKREYLKGSTNVSFIIDDSHTHSEDVKNWLEENGYGRYVSSEFAQVAFSFEHTMRGLEDEIIVHMPNSLNDHGLFIKAVTRARTTVICVTNPGSSFNSLLECPNNHFEMGTCDFHKNSTECPLIGQQILKKEKTKAWAGILYGLHCAEINVKIVKSHLNQQQMESAMLKCLIRKLIKSEKFGILYRIFSFSTADNFKNYVEILRSELGSTNIDIASLLLKERLGKVRDVFAQLSDENAIFSGVALLHEGKVKKSESYVDVWLFNKLTEAASEGNTAAVMVLCEAGAPVDRKKWNGQTVLHMASENGHLGTVDYLIKEGKANVNIADNNNDTAMNLAASEGHIDIVQLLLEAGAHVDRGSLIGQTAFGPINRNSPFSPKLTMKATKAGANIADTNNGTALHLAVKKGDTDLVKQLCEAGSCIDRKDYKGQTALHMAVETGHILIVEYLVKVERTLVDMADKNNYTPLHLASKKGHTEIIKLLCCANAQVNRKGGNSVQAALHIATQKDHLSAAEHLIKEMKADINMENKFGHTPLHLAALEGHIEMVKLICGAGAYVDKKCLGGSNALHIAIDSGHLSMAEYLIGEAKADVNIADKNNQTPLHQAATKGLTELVELTCKTGAHTNRKGLGGRTALHMTIECGHLSTAEYMIKGAKVKVDKTDSNKFTALHLAAKKGHLEAVKMLCEAGACINRKGFKGQTPLHLAIKKGHLSTAEYLIERQWHD